MLVQEGTRDGISFRAAIALTLCAHACFLLGLVGLLRHSWVIAIVAVALLVRSRVHGAVAIAAAPLVHLALYPPFAFDETLYHLLFVRAFAEHGALQFLFDLRFPVFPVLHEVLCVPAYLLAGEAGPHLIAVLELMIIAGLLVEWGKRYDVRAGWLAAAMFLGSPLVIHLGTVLYVEIALTLMVVAGFYALERERYALAGLFFGSACSVKYLGFYFAAVALILVVVRRRSIVAFTSTCVAAALPMTAWIVFHTGNPVFPFLHRTLWTPPPSPPIAFTDRVVGLLRMIWDVTFARERIGLQPPVTPFLVVLVALVIAAAMRTTQARQLLLISAGYILLFSFLPPDSRYLVPLLPLLSLAAAVVVARRWPRAVVWVAVIAIAPGIAYAGYRIVRQGVPPITERQRNVWLTRHVPGYHAVGLTGKERIYACGAERLKSYAGGEFLGDYTGPYSYARVLDGAVTTQEIRERMLRIHARSISSRNEPARRRRGTAGCSSSMRTRTCNCGAS